MAPGHSPDGQKQPKNQPNLFKNNSKTATSFVKIVRGRGGGIRPESELFKFRTLEASECQKDPFAAEENEAQFLSSSLWRRNAFRTPKARPKTSPIPQNKPEILGPDTLCRDSLPMFIPIHTRHENVRSPFLPIIRKIRLFQARTETSPQKRGVYLQKTATQKPSRRRSPRRPKTGQITVREALRPAAPAGAAHGPPSLRRWFLSERLRYHSRISCKAAAACQ